MTKLIITEKPSVAKNIADAFKVSQKRDGYFEGNDLVITWAFGHLLQLYDAKDYDSKMSSWKEDQFPFIPGQFKYKVKSDPKNKRYQDKGAGKQLKIIQYLMKRNDIDMIISACDFDREGQIIGDTIIYHLKPTKNVYRLLLNEWTPDEVIKGFENLKLNTEMKPLQDAGISRQWADWLIGINLTSVTTLKFQKGKGQALNIGRVLLPTLKIIYDRDKEIEAFVPEAYYKLSATFKTRDNKEYEGTYVENDQEKFKDKNDLEMLQQSLKNGTGTIVDKTVEDKKEYPPYLFNLSNLQGYITNKYKGWTSSKVLKVAQSLYEKKLITYPRTASNVLDESLIDKASKVLNNLKKGLSYEQEIKFTRSKRIFDSSKVDSHSAITPTYVLPKSLTPDEKVVYTAIKNRFIMQFMPASESQETKIVTKLVDDNAKGVFVTKGKTLLVEGWKKVEKIETKEAILPNVNKNDHVTVKDFKLSSHKTTPPKYHTEKTLLRVMETCGRGQEYEDSEGMMDAILKGYSIGTPATRAETIQKLKLVGYIEQQNKNLTCTALGRKLVEILPVTELFDLEFTGRLEKTLLDIEKQRFKKEDFLKLITEFTTTAVMKIKNHEAVIINESQSKRAEIKILGKCPVCSNAIIEGSKGYGCSNWKNGCKFVIWKNDKFLSAMKKKPTQTMVKTLLKEGSVTVKGLTSKKGNKFEAKLRYEKNVDNDYFSWKMEFLKGS